MSEGQIEAFIRRLACPILFVYGTESDFMKSVRGHRAQLFPNAKIVPIEGAGHHIPHEKPEELAEVVVPFLLSGVNNCVPKRSIGSKLFQSFSEVWAQTVSDVLNIWNGLNDLNN